MSRGSSIGHSQGTPSIGHQAEPEVPAEQKQSSKSKKYLPDNQEQTQPASQRKKLSERMSQRAETPQNLPSVQESPFHHFQDKITCSDDITELRNLYTALEDEQFLVDKNLDQQAAKELKQHLQQKLTPLARAKISVIETPTDLKESIDCLPMLLQKARAKRQLFQHLFTPSRYPQAGQKPISIIMAQCKESGQTAALLEQLSRLKEQTSDRRNQQQVDEAVMQIIEGIFSTDTEEMDLEALRTVYLKHTSDDDGITPVWDKLTEQIAHSGPDILDSGDQEAIQLMFDICRESAKTDRKYVKRISPLIEYARTCDSGDLQATRNGIFNFGLAVEMLNDKEARNQPRQTRGRGL